MRNCMHLGCQGGGPMPNLHTNAFCELLFSHSSLKIRPEMWKIESLGKHFGHQNRVPGHFGDTANFNRFARRFRIAFWLQDCVKLNTFRHTIYDTFSNKIGTDSQMSSKSRFHRICVVFVSGSFCFFVSLYLLCCCLLRYCVFVVLVLFVIFIFICLFSFALHVYVCARCILICMLCSFSCFLQLVSCNEFV